MNELWFIFHNLIIFLFLLYALKRGKLFLVCFIAFQGILANLFVIKQIQLFSFNVTTSDVYAVASILGLNLVREYYGKKTANLAITLGLFLMLFFVLMGQFQIFYTPSQYDWSQNAYATIFSSSPRIVFCSIAVFFCVQKLDLFLFSFLKNFFKNRFLYPRILSSLIFSQLIDTILFSYLALYGLVQSIFDIILFSFLVKMTIAVISSAFIFFIKSTFFKNHNFYETTNV